MWEIIKSIILGIVEGVTEWLPVSSTGHMILVDSFLHLNVDSDPAANEKFKEMFLVVIQLGAILAVVLLFWHKIWPFGKKNNRVPLSKTGFGAYLKMDIVRMWCKVIVACVPAAIVGLLFDEKIDELFYNHWVVSIALIVFGVAFLLVERWNKDRTPRISHIDRLPYRTAMLIGVFQLIAAVFPGTSRSGATIVGALLLGVSRVVAAEFTFYLAIPVMFGASLLKLVKHGFAFTGLETAVLLVGMLVAFLVSVFVIRFLMDYIKKHDFTVFGWYRSVLGILVIICGLTGVIQV